MVQFLFLFLLQENTANTSFDDLGKLLFGGVIAAILLAVAFTLVRMKLRDKRTPSSSFISINASDDK
jgi:hypothetical protein